MLRDTALSEHDSRDTFPKGTICPASSQIRAGLNKTPPASVGFPLPTVQTTFLNEVLKNLSQCGADALSLNAGELGVNLHVYYPL